MATVRYLVNDVDEALAFYQQALGFSLRVHPAPPFAMIERGDLLLWIAGPGTSARKAMPDGRVPVITARVVVSYPSCLRAT